MGRNVKPIETPYANCVFRSRAEARWAVFFDVLGYEWEYEAEGFETAAGRYLPDFWLPGQRKWIEVKGTLKTTTPRDWRRWYEFGFDRWDRGERFAVLTRPLPRAAKEFPISTVTYTRMPDPNEMRGPDATPPDEPIAVAKPGKGNPNVVMYHSSLIDEYGEDAAGFMPALWVPDGSPRQINEALNAARSHRFGT